MKRLLVLLTLCFLFSVITQAQDLTQTYTAKDGSFSFRYPSDWTVNDSNPGDIVLTSPGGATIAVLDPDVVSRVATNLTAAETLQLMVNFTRVQAGDVTDVQAGEHAAVRATFIAGDGDSGLALAVSFGDKRMAVIIALNNTGDATALEPTVLALAASLNGGSTPAEATAEATAETTPDVSATEAPLPAGVLFRDDFESGLKTDWTATQGTPTIIQDGDNHVLRVDSNAAYYLKSGADWTDYAADLRVKVTQPAAIDGLVGVRFNPQAVTTYGAFFNTQDDRVGLAYFFGDNKFNILSNSRVNLSAGQWYNLTLSVKGGLVELYIGSHRTNWLNSSQFDRGTFAVYASPNAQLTIDDVVIRDLRG